MKRTIIISGGLGNQMFQYALYYSLKQKGVLVDKNTTLFEYNRMHNGYMLDIAFGIQDCPVCKNKFSVLWTRFVRSKRVSFLLFKEDENRFCKDVYTTNKPYIDGCWIDERYFFDIKDKVRAIFSFYDIDQNNLSIASTMQSCNSVSLHIRRGDYLNNPRYNVCDELYYKNAIGYILKRICAPKFFIFSDDSEWCKSFMEKFGVEFDIIQHNIGRDCYKDMFLMTQCKHNIIANSTFSWWGAWLNGNKEKIVVCPSIWINGRTHNPCLEEWNHL